MQSAPDNKLYQRHLSYCYTKIAGMDGERDPVAARGWREKTRAIFQRLVP